MLHPLRPPLVHRKSDPGAARQGKEGLGTINGFPPTPRPTMPISRTILTLSQRRPSVDMHVHFQNGAREARHLTTGLKKNQFTLRALSGVKRSKVFRQ